LNPLKKVVADVFVTRTSAERITTIHHTSLRSPRKKMKKVMVLVSAVFMLAAVSTSCNKTGCHCYVKTDVMHVAPAYEDETSTKEECKAMQDKLNEEAGMDFYRCNQ
jgi:hypothetical protein